MDVLSPRGEFRPLFGWLRLAGKSKSRSPLLRRGSTASCLHYVSQDRTSSMIACMTEGVRRCQFATSSRSASGANTYGNRDAGAIPAHRFVPAWRVGVLDLLDRRAAEHGQSPPIRRSARRHSDRRIARRGDIESAPVISAPASSAERCIRKAVDERGLSPGPVGLADATAEDEPRVRPGYGICKQRLDRRARRPRGSPYSGFRSYGSR